jgi:hypothetical protein
MRLPPSWRFFLLFKTLLERFHELVPPHLFDLGFFFGAQFQLKVFAQPLQGHILGEVGHHLHALEVGGKGAVEFVVMLFVLHQRGAAQVIKVVNLVAAAVLVVAVGAHHAFFQRFHERQVFLDGDGQLGAAQGVEKVNQHGVFLRAYAALSAESSGAALR